jgi:hypothetical protein
MHNYLCILTIQLFHKEHQIEGKNKMRNPGE